MGSNKSKKADPPEPAHAAVTEEPEQVPEPAESDIPNSVDDIGVDLDIDMEPAPDPNPNHHNETDDSEDDDDIDFETEDEDEVPIIVIEEPLPPTPATPAGTTQRQNKRAGANDEDTEGDQPAPKRPAEVAQGTINENMATIRQAIEQMMGQSFTGIAQNFLRNEAALSTTVESLRRIMTPHRGHLEPSWEEFLTVLGPPRPTPPPQPPVTSDSSEPTAGPPADPVNPPNPGPTPLTEATVKEILRHLGRIFELYAALIKKLGYGEGNVTSGNVTDNNRVAYVIGQVINQVADMLQYTYRKKLHNVSREFTNQAPRSKDRIETAIAKAREGQGQTPGQNNATGVTATPRALPFLQVLPAIEFPPLDEPQIRYRILIPRDDLMTMTHPTHVLQDVNSSSSLEEFQQTMTQGEENLLIRFGTLDIFNGTRTAVANFSAHGVNFRLYQSYISQGWVDGNMADPPGQYVRSLEFLLEKFKKGSIQHEIKAKPRTEKLLSSSEQNGSHEVEIIVSGVVEGAYTIGGVVGQRVEFVFILPPHLTIKHINDVGVRDSVLKIQFAK